MIHYYYPSKNKSVNDKKDWDNFLSSKEKLPNKDKSFQKKQNQKIDSIDLHGYSIIGANKKINHFIKQSYINNVNKLIVVTGKGLHSQNDKDPYVSKDLSILKYSVPEFIKRDDELMKIINYFQDASIEDGGTGAFYIYLKKKI